jgi:predicted neuraminidase
LAISLSYITLSTPRPRRVTGDKNLYLFHTSQGAKEDGQSQETSFIVRLVSADHGRTWGPPMMVSDLSAGRGAFVKGNILPSADGTQWLLPMYYTPDIRKSTTHYCSLRRSSDKGLTWTVNQHLAPLSAPSAPSVYTRAVSGRWWLASSPRCGSGWQVVEWDTTSERTMGGPGRRGWQPDVVMAGRGAFAVQPYVFRLPPMSSQMLPRAELHALFRDRRGHTVLAAVSPDDGRSWPLHVSRTRLPNNNAGIAVAVLESGSLVRLALTPARDPYTPAVLRPDECGRCR